MLSSKKILIYTCFVLGCIFFYLYERNEEQKYLAITSFDQCVTAGYQILLTYPETCRTPDRRIFSNQTQTIATTTPLTTVATTTKEDFIIVESVAKGDLLTSPLTIKGKARGQWFFEASFPVELLDGNGKQVVIKAAQAQSDWMTEDYVPFEVTLSFKVPTTATGTIVFHKDNPSGDIERDASLSIPVRFK